MKLISVPPRSFGAAAAAARRITAVVTAVRLGFSTYDPHTGWHLFPTELTVSSALYALPSLLLEVLVALFLRTARKAHDAWRELARVTAISHAWCASVFA